MSIEYCSLTIMSIIFLVAWLPASLAKWKTFGMPWLLSNRTPIKNKELESWGARCERAHNNLKEFFPAFIVAIIVLGLTNKFDQSTEIASITFVVARIGHFISYGVGSALARAGFFFIGFLSNFYLLIKIFN